MAAGWHPFEAAASLPLRYFRGAVAPWPAVFVGLIGGRILVAEIWRNLPAPLTALLFATLLLLDFLLLCSQVIGAWRCLNAGLDPAADRFARIAGQVIVVLAVPVAVNVWIDRLAAEAPRPAPDLVAPKPLPVSDGVAELTGDIDYASLDRFDATSARFSTLRLDSRGGLVFAARALAQRVARRGLATEVTGECLSSCTLVFMASRHRILGPDARLGFHAYAAPATAATLDVAAEQRKDSLFLQEQGVDMAFLMRVEATPPDQMWFPDRATLRAAGVLGP